MVSSRGSLGTARQSDTATPALSRASALDAFSERGGAGQGAGGACSGAGWCRAVRKAARVSAASAARVTGARSAGSPGTQVVTIQGRGNRAEGSPRRCGTGTGSEGAGRGRAPRCAPCAASRPRTASPRANGRRGRRRAARAGWPSPARRASQGNRPGRGAGRAADPAPTPR